MIAESFICMFLIFFYQRTFFHFCYLLAFISEFFAEYPAYPQRRSAVVDEMKPELV